MSIHSVGTILSIEDPTLFYEIKSFLERVPGVRIIYITMTTNNCLYVTSERRMQEKR